MQLHLKRGACAAAGISLAMGMIYSAQLRINWSLVWLDGVELLTALKVTC